MTSLIATITAITALIVALVQVAKLLGIVDDGKRRQEDGD